MFVADIRDDDVVALLDAIRMLKGVLSVTTDVVDSSDWMNRERIRFELRQKLFEILK